MYISAQKKGIPGYEIHKPFVPGLLSLTKNHGKMYDLPVLGGIYICRLRTVARNDGRMTC